MSLCSVFQVFVQMEMYMVILTEWSQYTDLSSSPTGQENTSGSCTCLGSNSNAFAEYMVCQQHKNSSPFAGYCISYSNQSKQVIVAKCPFFSGCKLPGPIVSLLIRNVNEVEEIFYSNRWIRWETLQELHQWHSQVVMCWVYWAWYKFVNLHFSHLLCSLSF